MENVVLCVYFDDMGVLRNYRHELFAEAVANGYSAVKAHEIAGFLPDRGNAWRLQRRHDIRQRIDQLIAGRTRAVDAAVTSAAARVGIDQEWVLRNLKLNALMSMRAGDRSAAARSLELLGKHLGLFIDKNSVEINVVDDSDEYLAQLLELVGKPVIEHEPVQLQDPEKGRAAGRRR